ncbi:MAG: hypothetical protein IJ093_00910 [Bacilli bacterium]|nr:hypothetical protein [Bacilli bacterium]
MALSQDSSTSLGFNPDVVNAAITKINEAYTAIATAIGSETQNQFVQYVSENWAAPQAQKYFAKVDEAFNSLKASIDTIFQSVADSMNSAGSIWSGVTGRPFNRVSYTKSSEKIDVSIIKESINGVSGITTDCGSTAKSRLSTIMNKIDSELGKAAAAVSSPDVSGFTQGASGSLAASLKQIQSNVSSTSNDLTTGLGNATQSTVETYQEAESKIAQAFAGNE